MVWILSPKSKLISQFLTILFENGANEDSLTVYLFHFRLKMNSVKLFILFAATVLTAEATFVLGTGTLAVTGAGAGLAALLGIKAAAVGGLALGAALSRRRHYYRPSYRRARYALGYYFPYLSIFHILCISLYFSWSFYRYKTWFLMILFCCLSI